MMSERFDEIMGNLNWSHLYNDQVTLDDQQVREFEEKIGYDLPKDYRQFLKRYGFTILSNSGLPLDGVENELKLEVEVFYGLRAEDSYDLVQMKEGFEGELLSEFLPIADASGGQLCLCLGGERAGVVCWWYPHEQFEDPKEEYQFVSASFTEFMDNLVWIE